MIMLPDHMLIETSTAVSEQNAPIVNTLQEIIYQTAIYIAHMNQQSESAWCMMELFLVCFLWVTICRDTFIHNTVQALIRNYSIIARDHNVCSHDAGACLMKINDCEKYPLRVKLGKILQKAIPFSSYHIP